MSAAETKDQLQARVEALSAERAELWRELHERRAEERRVEDLQAEVDYLRGTLSWRITAPLRTGKRIKHRAKLAWLSRPR